MANVSGFLAPQSSGGKRSPQHRGPGSNGYFRREMWAHAGAYTWTAPKSGKIRIIVAGPASGANRHSGAGGGMAIHESLISTGDTVNVTVGAGSLGSTAANAVAAAGTSTVVCDAASISITANGGGGHTSDGATGGSSAGGNVSNYKGGDGEPSNQTGGASCAKPWGDGENSQSDRHGGLGWAPDIPVGSGTYGGSGSATAAIRDSYAGGSGLTARGGVALTSTTNARGNGADSIHGGQFPWWDVTDIDGGGGGGSGGPNNEHAAGSGGPGGGGGGSYNAPAGDGGIFGGGGSSHTLSGGNGGNGGGGGSSQSRSGGRGGDGLVIIFWDTDEDAA